MQQTIELCIVTGADGKEYFAYVSFSTENYPRYLRAMETGATVNLEDLGEILEWGEGSEPSEEVRAFMEEQYQLTHHRP